MAKIKLEKQVILSAAIKVLQSGQNLNARNLASALNCSTQPIYSVFKDMNELKRELVGEIAKVQKQKVEIYLNSKNYPPYKAYGMGFVRFAKDENELFKFLYMQQPTSLFGLEKDALYSEVIASMQKTYGFTKKQAENFHADMSIYTYGLAVMQSLSGKMTDAEISAALQREYMALSSIVKEKK